MAWNARVETMNVELSLVPWVVPDGHRDARPVVVHDGDLAGVVVGPVQRDGNGRDS
jgi:hypothetical protein